MMVHADSARQFAPNEKWEMVDADHSQIAKVNRGEGGIYSSLLSTIRNALSHDAYNPAWTRARDGELSSQMTAFPNDSGVGFTRLGDQKRRNSPTDEGSTELLRHNLDRLHFTLPDQPVRGPASPSMGQSPGSSKLSIPINDGETDQNIIVPNIELELPSGVKDSTDTVHEDGNKTVSAVPEESAPLKTSLVVSESHDAVAVTVADDSLLAIDDKDSPLFKALKKGDCAALDFICKYESLERCDDTGLTPLAFAAMYGLVPQARVLLAHGAQWDVKTAAGLTPFLLACGQNRVEVVNLLLPKVDVNRTYSPFEQSALLFACRRGHLEVVELLLSKGAQIDLRDEENDTPLHAAVRCGHVKLVKMLLERGANVQLSSKYRYNKFCGTPFHTAIWYDQYDTVRLLLDAGCDPNFPVPEWNALTPLVIASMNGHTGIIKLLLERGAMIDFHNLDDSGHNPVSAIQQACYYGKVDAVRLLIERNASLWSVPYQRLALGKYSGWFHRDVTSEQASTISRLVRTEVKKRKAAAKRASGL